jgi:hypothetical protein
MISPQMWLNTTYKQGGDIERGLARTDCEGTGEEPLDGAACNLGACVCSGYRGSSMAAIEIMKREIERERWRDRRERRSWKERVEREKDSGGVREWRGVGQRHSYN